MKKRNNPKIDAMKQRSLIVESERQNLHTPKFYLTEQEEEIKRPAGDPYEYKKDETGYYFKKRDEENWKKTNNSAVKGVFGDGGEKPVTKSSNQSKSSGKPKNIKGFQQWVINTKGDKSILGKGGDSGYGDDGIWGTKTAKAWNKYGSEYKNKKSDGKATSKKDTILSKYSNKNFVINPNEISSTDTTKLSCSAGGKNCATFVNDYSDKISSVGDAWLSHDQNSSGKRVWTAYHNLDDDDVNKMTEIYKDIKKQGGAIDNKKSSNIISKIKNLQKSIIGKKGKPSDLKIDDIVGIYWPSSKHHEEAFEKSADQGLGYFKPRDVNAKPGKTLSDGIGFGFNTHVGIVGAIKDGKPIIFHNTGDGKITSEPADSLNIVWVKRTGGEESAPVKDEEGNWFTDIISYFS